MVTGQEQQAGELLSKAVYEEEVNGELDEAITSYQFIIKQYPENRRVSAEALLHLGTCYEKLGNQEARKTYRQVIQKYADQSDLAAEATARLAALEKHDGPEMTKNLAVRQVWSGPDVDIEGAPSPDGRYLSYTDWETGDLAIYEIATGKKQSLTNEGSINPAAAQFAYFSKWSANSKQIVYDWFNEKSFVELRIIGIDGSKPRVLYRNEEVVWAQTCDWSVDGTKILAGFFRKDGTIQIVLVSTEDGSVRILKTLEKELPRNFQFSMKLSPDGHYIVYDLPQKTGSSERDIFLLSTNGKSDIAL